MDYYSRRNAVTNGQNTVLTIQDFPLSGRAEVARQSVDESVRELVRAGPQQMCQIVAVEIGSVELLLHAHVDVQRLAV